VGRDAFGDPGDELPGFERSVGHHDRYRDLTGPLVGPWDDRGVGDLRMTGEQRFDLGRGNLECSLLAELISD
jgi:hypothetical protein